MYSFRYKPGPKKVGFGQQRTRYVARPYYGPKSDEKDILRQIVRNYPGMQRGMVAAALDAVANEFVNFLLTGHAVKLMWVGTFRLSFDSRSQERPEQLTSADISCPRIIFTPDPELKRMMREELRFEAVADDFEPEPEPVADFGPEPEPVADFEPETEADVDDREPEQEPAADGGAADDDGAGRRLHAGWQPVRGTPRAGTISAEIARGVRNKWWSGGDYG